MKKSDLKNLSKINLVLSHEYLSIEHIKKESPLYELITISSSRILE